MECGSLYKYPILGLHALMAHMWFFFCWKKKSRKFNGVKKSISSCFSVEKYIFSCFSIDKPIFQRKIHFYGFKGKTKHTLTVEQFNVKYWSIPHWKVHRTLYIHFNIYKNKLPSKCFFCFIFGSFKHSMLFLFFDSIRLDCIFVFDFIPYFFLPSA